MVFPELNPEVYYSALLDKPSTQVFTKSLWNKLRQRKAPETEATFDQKVDSQDLDVVYDTGKGYFIIKDFKDQVVTSDKLKTFLETISKHFSKIFRVIVVAKDYESKLTDETLEEQMSKLSREKFPFDLIVEEKLGYSVVWIGEN